MRLLLAVTASIALLAAACGSGDDAVAASSDDDDATTESSTGDDALSESDEDNDTDTGSGENEPVADEWDYTPTQAMPDITGPTVHPIHEVVVSEDGMTLGVRYQGAAEPCSGAVARVVEDDTTIAVTLETGLSPEAAAMTCIAKLMLYELAIGLDAPVGDREIIITGLGDGTAGSDDDTSDGSDTSGEDDGAMEDRDGLSAPDSFIGLSLDEAGAKADAEGRAWRISRQDEEQFGLTADYNMDRVTFEVDAGIVTAAVGG